MWPAVISLLATLLRLVGELQGWSAPLFGPGGETAAGDPIPMGKFGITPLIPIVGIYPGYRLQKTEGAPPAKRTLAIFALAILAMAGLIALFVSLGQMRMPNPKNGEAAEGFAISMVVFAVGVFVACSAWRRLALSLLLYAFLARIPVVIVTWLSVSNGWVTHYARQMKGLPPLEGMEKVRQLTEVQVGFWIVITVIFGGLFGVMGAQFAKGSRSN